MFYSGLWHSKDSDRGGSGENLAWRDEGNDKVCNKVSGVSFKLLA